MDIGIPLRELGEIDVTALRKAILAQDDGAWKEDKYRQEAFEVHHSTESIVMVFVDIERWPPNYWLAERSPRIPTGWHINSTMQNLFQRQRGGKPTRRCPAEPFRGMAPFGPLYSP